MLRALMSLEKMSYDAETGTVIYRCKGPLRIIALINDPPVVRRILEHLELWRPEASERSPPVPPEAWPLHRVLPMTYHPYMDSSLGTRGNSAM